MTKRAKLRVWTLIVLVSIAIAIALRYLFLENLTLSYMGTTPRNGIFNPGYTWMEITSNTIYGFMMLFDGVMETATLDTDHSVEFALMGRVYNIQTGQRLEEIELAPEGDGLCMGFHMWADGEFE